MASDWLMKATVDSAEGVFVDRSSLDRITLKEIVERFKTEVMFDGGPRCPAHLAQGGGGLIIDPVVAGLLWDEREGLAVGLLEAAEAVRRGLPRIWLATRLAPPGCRIRSPSFMK